MEDYWVINYDEPQGLSIHLEKKITMTRAGFGSEPSIYPVTIVHARYNGTYEGGLGAASWLCFPVAPHKLQSSPWDGWDDSDVECAQWWDSAEGWPIGKGNSPGEAYYQLIKRVAEDAGVQVMELMESPTWDRGELARRTEKDDS